MPVRAGVRGIVGVLARVRLGVFTTDSVSVSVGVKCKCLSLQWC